MTTKSQEIKRLKESLAMLEELKKTDTSFPIGRLSEFSDAIGLFMLDVPAETRVKCFAAAARAK